jgi:hypothetical protein
VTELALGQLQPAGAGAARTVWSFNTTQPLVDILEPGFLGRHYARSVVEGDMVMFSCGGNGHRTHGIAVVIGAWPGAGESSGAGAVVLQLLCSNGSLRGPTRLKVAS